MSTPIEAYIRQAAAARGIDPDIAVRVAKSEGGLQNPVRQSDVVKNGVREPSFGPFQLYMNGGLGSRALAAGIDPRDPNQWRGGVDYALNEAAQKGWGQWYGSKAVGIAPFQGIGGAHPADISAASPYAGMADGPKGQEAYPAPSPFGSMAPPPVDNSIDPSVAKYAFADQKDTWANRLSKAGQAFDAPLQAAPRPAAWQGGPSAEQAGGLLKATSNTNQLAQMLLGRRIA
jgi:hypothetical protein